MNNRTKTVSNPRAAEFARVRESRVNIEANGIRDDLQAVAGRIRRLLAEGHGDTCRCTCCESEILNQEGILDDLRGLAWAIETGAGSLESVLLPTEAKKRAMLREFVAEMRAKQATAKK